MQGRNVPRASEVRQQNVGKGLAESPQETLTDPSCFPTVDDNFWVEQRFPEVNILKSLKFWTHLASSDQIKNF